MVEAEHFGQFSDDHRGPSRRQQVGEVHRTQVCYQGGAPTIGTPPHSGSRSRSLHEPVASGCFVSGGALWDLSFTISAVDWNTPNCQRGNQESAQWAGGVAATTVTVVANQRRPRLKICFLNPFGTPAYDELITGVLAPTVRDDVDLVVRHLDVRPENLDYYAAKHLVEVGIMRSVLQAERDGFDAFVIGCCYDPALTQARELVDIPVVGPLEASLGFARSFGHRFAIVTDHDKAVPELMDRVRLYGQEPSCRGVTSVGWFVDDMVKDPDAVADDAYKATLEVMRNTGAESVIIGCTIVSACYERAALAGDHRLQQVSVLNPNLMAVKQAEALADMAAHGQYRISRAGYYQKLRAHSHDQANELETLLSTQA
jgi:allantoin racemase